LTMNRDPVEGERLLREQLAMLHRHGSGAR
jgi:hypothetical protein